MTPTDSPTSTRNRCVTELFGIVLCCCIPFYDVPFRVEAFGIGLSLMPSLYFV